MSPAVWQFTVAIVFIAVWVFVGHVAIRES